MKHLSRIIWNGIKWHEHDVCSFDEAGSGWRDERPDERKGSYYQMVIYPATPIWLFNWFSLEFDGKMKRILWIFGAYPYRIGSYYKRKYFYSFNFIPFQF